MERPSEKSIKRMRIYVEKYLQKTGTSAHPEGEVTESCMIPSNDSENKTRDHPSVTVWNPSTPERSV